ncbi:uncharacterized protein RCC_06843 [Ramularia collo-cygni]|uniref:AA1-like domain-containing protein n=1 Tax=Ramularia collo-cygni TaxID=112498 RepID=A0A2D3UTU5_9PEZI|nr:uncharacterized protein RCC_06843 [Ramularia collo-cygni]CZT20982.1 uncharacterized protein RCC_06843 [Ramularia collo-cygni]
MQSFVFASVLALLASSAIAAPTSCKAPATPSSEKTIYQIKDFYERKPDGKDITALGFNIAATNGGTLDFTCVPYDPVTKAAAANFEDGHVYTCGANSLFSFSYSEKDDANKGKLFLWQGASPADTIQGSTMIPTPYCHAGGAGPNDLACVVPAAVGEIKIEMAKP